MKERATKGLVVATFLASLVLGAGTLQAATAGEASPPLTLEALEQMALAHNPRIGQGQARLEAARGQTRQAGLYPNPMVGYMGDEISTGPVIRGGEHGFFVEQEVVTGGKLRLSRQVAAEGEVETAAEAEADRYRVLNRVRLLYYAALGAKRVVEVETRLADLAQQAAQVSRQLLNVGQADEPDAIEAEVEAGQAQLALQSAQRQQEQVWRQLAAAVGVPSLAPAPLAGALEQAVPELNFEQLWQDVLRGSPELKRAEAEAVRRERALQRAQVEWIPNLVLRGGLRDNRERLEQTGAAVGLEGFVEAGVQLPLFNRNQGNVQSARAATEEAGLEVERVRLSLRSRLAAAFRRYQDARALVEKYNADLLPRAQRAYQLYSLNYQHMAAAYPQVLIAQRTLFQLEVTTVKAEVGLWQAVTELRGLLLVDDEPAAPAALGETATQR